MELLDWAARWNPVPHEPPCRVWLPAQRVAAGRSPAAATPRAPRSLVVPLTGQQAAELPSCLSGLLAQLDLRPGDRVTVDLADHAPVHVTGLELLMTVLWRRVGTHGEVLLTGGAPGLRAQLASLDVTPATCRAAVHGPPPAPAGVPAPVPRPAPTGVEPPPRTSRVPAQRRPQDPPQEADIGWDARLTWRGEVNLTVDLRTQARLNDLLEQRETRTLAIDLSDVTSMSLSTLRLLLAADRRLRARGGRLRLLHPGPRVQHLLASTRTTSLADLGPRPAHCAAAPQDAAPVPPGFEQPEQAPEARTPVAGAGQGLRRPRLVEDQHLVAAGT